VSELVAQLARNIGSTNSDNDLKMVRIMGATVTLARLSCKDGFRLTVPGVPGAFGLQAAAALVYCVPIMWQLVKEFMLFLQQEKKWWLIPLIIMLLILGVLLIFGSSPLLAPFMYPFM